ncbi:MAG: hypothetical protein A2Z38_00665 [Planctomycetes bacterium RBG_19FT_COMBO_48_8]|nr:MAG: hypothetical protein A2Z38_00665 [Planctomycetes bacterium RBG_19FT_COMBO_48_8]
MADYDSDMIKPVQSLKNISGLTPVKEHEERKRRQQLHHENEKKEESARGEETPPEEQGGNKSDINSDNIGIDYCA